MQILPQKRSVAPAVLEALGVFHFDPINLLKLYHLRNHIRLDIEKCMCEG